MKGTREQAGVQRHPSMQATAWEIFRLLRAEAPLREFASVLRLDTVLRVTTQQ